MEYFFFFETELPVGEGFRLFGMCHIIWLIGIAAFSWLSGKWFLRQNVFVQDKVCHIVGTMLPVMGILRDVILGMTGHFDIGFLPLHLCSMAMWITFLYVWTWRRFWGVIYTLVCLPGTVGALLFPNWDMYPVWNYMHIHAFLSHGLIFALGIWLLWSGRLIPEWKEFWIPVVFGLTGFFILYPLNCMWGTNFWFLNQPSHGSPLVNIWNVTGRNWYLPAFFLFCLLIVAAWQLAITIFDKRLKSQ